MAEKSIKEGPTKTEGFLMKGIFLFTLMFIISLVAPVGNLLWAQPVPTNEWVNFFSTNTTYDGSPVPVGAVVDAYDPDGVWCGTFTVHTSGQYGFLLVYRDDSTTPDIDEGASPRDTITFYVNGHLALPLGPGSPVWTANGDIIELNLEGHSNYPPIISGFPALVVFRADTTVKLVLNDYVEDINDPDLGLHWSVSGNDSVIVTINPATNIAEISAPLTYLGTESLVFTVTDDSLASDSDTLIVEVIPYIRTITIPLSAGWNLISWDVDTPEDLVGVLLSDIMSDLVVVLGFEGGGLTYDPDWPQFSTLGYLDHLHGYWMKSLMENTLSLTGVVVPGDSPIVMEAGWNLISYLPDHPDSTAHALSSIFDNIVVILGFNQGGLTYDPDWPQFSNLQILSPGFGYWVKMTSADTLIYPDHQVVHGQSVNATIARTSIAISQPVPTNEWVNFMSTGSTFDGLPLSIGAVVDAHDPDTVWCGTFTVTTEGQYGFLLVYRDDATTPDVDEGAEPGDTITFHINGHLALPMGSGEPVWTANGDVIQLDLEGHSNYPPVISGFPDSLMFRADSTVILDLNQYVEDIDNPDSTLHWSVTGNDSVRISIDPITNMAELSVPLTYSGTETLVFTVTDDSLALDSDTLIVDVLPLLIIIENNNIPTNYFVSQNYPNPFNPITTLKFDIPIATNTSVVIYDLLGREIIRLLEDRLEPGYYKISWDGKTSLGIDAPTGIYIARLLTPEYSKSIKMLLLK